MFNRNKAIASIALASLYLFAAEAFAATAAEAGVESEVNSCVAEVRQNLDYSDATRVRHDVLAIERRTVGYTLKISTSLFSESGSDIVRAYATTCVVNGNNKPLAFEITNNS
jgi:hypothetical protein